jgi:hypothetical protein
MRMTNLHEVFSAMATGAGAKDNPSRVTCLPEYFMYR